MRRVPALLALLLASTSAFSAADVLLVERPAALRILDRYQQSIQHPAVAGIVPFTPMMIIQERGTLSDGFTPAVRVEIDAETFFLLTDEAGGVLRAGDPGTVRRYRGIEPLGDTIEVLGAGRLLLRDPLMRSSITVEAGARLRREFRSGSDTYVRLLDAADRFGWVTLRDRDRLWRPYRAESRPASEALHATQGRVQELLDRTNALLDSLFAFMNTRVRASREAPRWQLERSAGGLSCVLRGLPDPEAMAESTAALARRIELAVSGSGLSVTHSAGIIRIRP